MENEKIKNIEFLRIIGCIAILWLHIFANKYLGSFSEISLYTHLHDVVRNGQKAVDLFFILSGFFFAYKLNLHITMWDFIKKKILRFYPVLIFVIIASFIISLFGIIKFDLYGNILLIFGVYGTPLNVNIPGTRVHAGQFWYVSSMLWVLGFYFYLLKNYEKKTVNLVIFLIIFFCYSLLMNANGGKIAIPKRTFYNIFNVGLMRGFAGIGVGYFIGEWWKNNSEKITAFKTNLYQKILISSLEFGCLYFMIDTLICSNLKFSNDMIYIIDFSAIIMLFLMQKGYISTFLNIGVLGNLNVNIAKYSYSIYMVHLLIYKVFYSMLWKQYPELLKIHPVENIIITLTTSIIIGILVYHLAEYPANKFFKKYIKYNK